MEGRIVSVNGPVVKAKGMSSFSLREMCLKNFPNS